MQHEIIIRNVYCKITQKTININGLIRTKKRESTDIVQAIYQSPLSSLYFAYTQPYQFKTQLKIKSKKRGNGKMDMEGGKSDKERKRK